jgi:two-component system KDP operon response regulator KdpE
MSPIADNSRVLVVDNQAAAARVLAVALAGHGYQVKRAEDGRVALLQFAEWRPAIVLTDLLLPLMGGLELCRRIRARSRVPIIVVSEKDEQAAKVEALDIGADDYVTKPFGTGELLARIRATLRRTNGEAEIESFDAGDFRVDMDTHRVHVRDIEVRLTPKEFDLFVYMARRPNRVLDRRKLLAAVWGEMSTEQPEYLRVFMGQLRKKLEPDPSKPRHLLTEPWVGYMFRPHG